MNKSRVNASRSWSPFVALLLLLTAVPAGRAATPAQKMKPEEVVARHLESIGTAEDRAAAKTRLILGVTNYNRRGTGGGSAEGRAVLASKGEKVMVGMRFGIPGYEVESMGYDGNKVTVGYVAPGRRSVLETFIRNHESTFKHRLLGGALSTGWPLLDLAGANAKLEYSGLKKIDNRPVHELKYTPKKGSDLKVSLFFDAETFRHVRTQYDRTVAASIGGGGVDSSAGQSETRYRLVEDYADFKPEGKLTLPHSYKIQLTINSTGSSINDEWDLTLNQFFFDQPIDDKDFVVDIPLSD